MPVKPLSEQILSRRTRHRDSACQPNACQPLVSVIIPAYNAEAFIARTLTSVLNQTYPHIEAVVVDDGSTDSTADIVRQFAAADSRLKLYQQQNAGVAAARNRAIAASMGELIAPIDADDIWHSSNIKKQVALLASADESVGMVYSWTIDIDSADRPTGNIRAALYCGNIYPALLYTNTIGHGSACMIRRRCLERVGAYNLELRSQQAQGCEDWDLYLRIASCYRVGVVPELLVGYRITGGSMSAQSTAMKKSQQLTFADIERRFPHVCNRIRRWTASAEDRYACRHLINACNPSQAWQSLYRAFAKDPLVVLTTYESWTMLLRILMQALVSRSAVSRSAASRSAANRSAVSRSSSSAASSSLTDIPLKVDDIDIASPKGVKTTLRQLVSPLFPSPLVRRLRLRWVNAQVCPNRPEPKGLSARQVNQLRAEIRRRARQSDAPLDFGQLDLEQLDLEQLDFEQLDVSQLDSGQRSLRSQQLPVEVSGQ